MNSDLKKVKALVRLMHEQGITQLKIGDVEITLPKPSPSIKKQIMTISPEEMKAASASAMGNHKHAMEILAKKPTFVKDLEEKEIEELLFYHEKFEG